MNHITGNQFKDIVDEITATIDELARSNKLHLPKSYSAQNALKTAYIIIKHETVSKDKRPALEVCTPASIKIALLKMVLLGLDPMKKQVAFIVRGESLSCEPQYQGNIVLAKRHASLSHHYANVIYKDDVLEYTIDPETGRKVVLKHEQKLDNVDMNSIVGAYATLIFSDGKPNHVEIMSMQQIRTSWNQGMGNSPAHKNFPDQMSMKTVTNRGLKLYIQGSDDDGLDMIEEAQEKAEKAVPEIGAGSQEISIDDDQPKQIPEPQPVKSFQQRKYPEPEERGKMKKQQQAQQVPDDDPFNYATQQPTFDGPGF